MLCLKSVCHTTDRVNFAGQEAVVIARSPSVVFNVPAAPVAIVPAVVLVAWRSGRPQDIHCWHEHFLSAKNAESTNAAALFIAATNSVFDRMHESPRFETGPSWKQASSILDSSLGL